MKRTAIVIDNGEELPEVTCEEFGHNLSSQKVWWDPQSKQKYTFVDLKDFQYFEPYDGPVIHSSIYNF